MAPRAIPFLVCRFGVLENSSQEDQKGRRSEIQGLSHEATREVCAVADFTENHKQINLLTF
jgi:hypothetical protein